VLWEPFTFLVKSKHSHSHPFPRKNTYQLSSDAVPFGLRQSGAALWPRQLAPLAALSLWLANAHSAPARGIRGSGGSERSI